MTSWKNNNTLESRRLVEEVLNPTKRPEKVVARDLEHLRALIYERIKDQGLKRTSMTLIPVILLI